MSSEEKIAAVVLAAGASTRLGRPKQTLELAGQTLVERAVRVAMEAGLAPVIVVLQEAELLERLKAAGAEVLLNRRWFEGMATSIVTGVRWAAGQGATGVVLMACDQVLLRPAHLRALCARPQQVTASAYAGRKGVPAYFPAAVFPQLMALRGDTGAREMLHEAPAVLDEGLALDVDTEADLNLARVRLEGW